MKCPRDGNPLIEVAHPDQPALEAMFCDDCSGAFIKGFPVDKLAIETRLQTREEWDPEVSCPENCGKMDGHTLKDVAIDVCPTCGGVWMDGGEIESLLGSEYAKQLSATARTDVDVVSPLADTADFAIGVIWRLLRY